jgi:hypothetical protein
VCCGGVGGNVDGGMNFGEGVSRKWCCGGGAPEEREIDGSQ